jgi:hypothetical protein
MLAIVLLIGGDFCDILSEKDKNGALIAKGIIGALLIFLIGYLLRDSNTNNKRLSEIIKLEKKDAKKVNQVKLKDF